MSKFDDIYVIMVGGIGARLRPYTYALPKPLLTANGISPLEKTINNILARVLLQSMVIKKNILIKSVSISSYIFIWLYP